MKLVLLTALLFLSCFLFSQVESNYSEINSINLQGNFDQTNQGIANKITSDQNNNLYIAGYDNEELDLDPSPDNESLITKHFFAKYNSTLELQWAINLNSGENITDIKILNNGDIVTCGNKQQANSVIFPTLWRNTDTLFVKKYNESGTQLWERTLKSNDNNISIFIDTDASNNIYAVGSFFDTISIDDGFSTSSPTQIHPNVTDRIISTSIYMLKLDSDGNTQCLKTIIKSLVRPLFIGNTFGKTYHATNIFNYKNEKLYFSFYPTSAYGFTDHQSIDILENETTNTYFNHQLSDTNDPYLVELDTIGQLDNIFHINSNGRNHRRSLLITTLTNNMLAITSPFLGMSIDSNSPSFDLNYDFSNPGNTNSTASYLQGSSTTLDIAYYNDNCTNFNRLFKVNEANHSIRYFNSLCSNSSNDLLVSGVAGESLGSSNYYIDLDPNQNNTFCPPTNDHHSFCAIYSNEDKLIWGKYYTQNHSLTGGENVIFTVQTEGELKITSYIKNTVYTTTQESDKIKIYPNPALNIINIENIQYPFDYDIVNISGKIIESKTNQNSNSIIIDNIDKGIYILHLKDNTEQNKQIQFIKI